MQKTTMSSKAAAERLMEYDIALTLLSLQSGVISTPTNSPQPEDSPKTVQDEEPEMKTDTDPKTLILNCVISSEVEVETSPPTPSIQESVSPKSYVTQHNHDSSGASTSSAQHIIFDSPRSPSPMEDEPENYDIKKTRDVGTQTDDSLLNYSHNNNNMSAIDVKMVEEKMKTLQERNSNCECKLKRKRLDTSDNPVSSTNNVEAAHAYDNTENEPEVTPMVYEVTPSHSNSGSRPKHGKKSSTAEPMLPEQRPVLEVPTKKANGLVPIGEGNAKVPHRVLKTIDWRFYTQATRRLLTAVFTRDVLASHSLTGKRSPAFPNKPAKAKLNPILVNDIVQTVVERCQVAENMVRTSITTKCADESKMLRSKQKDKNVINKKPIKSKKKIKKERKNNQENIQPNVGSDQSDSDF